MDLWFTLAMTEPLSEKLPRDFASLRALIVARAEFLPRRLTQVATFAVENPDDMAFGTVASIAESANVQPSALVRFAQSLGYQGFSDLQEVFRSRLRDRVLNYDERLAQLRQHIPEPSKAKVIVDGFSQAAITSISELQHHLDPDQLERAIELLAAANTIYLVGLRRSFPISSYMAYALGKLGIKSRLVDAVGGLAQEDASFATPADCILAISFTPYASETVALTQSAKLRHVPIVAITDSPFSPLASSATTWFEIQEANFEGFRSMAATLTLAMALTVAVADRRSARLQA